VLSKDSNWVSCGQTCLERSEIRSYMVTLKDIAERVGRSVTTVSRALADCSDVNKETAERIKEVAAQLGYVPNTLAKRLQKQSTDTIGIVVHPASRGYPEPFFSEFLAGIGEKATHYGYDLLVTYAQEEHQMDTYRQLVEGRRVDGFILYRTLRDDPRANYLHSLNFPFASFGQVESIDRYSYIDEDGEYAMQLIVNHLVAMGHTRIGCICPSLEIMHAYIRYNGLVKSLAAHGLELEAALVREGYFDQKDGYEQALVLLNQPTPPTAIVGFNDMIAFGAINAAKTLGLHVGKEFAVTGFDNSMMAAYYRPPLTTISQPIFKIGGKLLEMLIQSLKDKEHEPSQLLLRPQLIIRESTQSL